MNVSDIHLKHLFCHHLDCSETLGSTRGPWSIPSACTRAFRWMSLTSLRILQLGEHIQFRGIWGGTGIHFWGILFNIAPFPSRPLSQPRISWGLKIVGFIPVLGLGDKSPSRHQCFPKNRIPTKVGGWPLPLNKNHLRQLYVGQARLFWRPGDRSRVVWFCSPNLDKSWTGICDSWQTIEMLLVANGNKQNQQVQVEFNPVVFQNCSVSVPLSQKRCIAKWRNHCVNTVETSRRAHFQSHSLETYSKETIHRSTDRPP